MRTQWWWREVAVLQVWNTAGFSFSTDWNFSRCPGSVWEGQKKSIMIWLGWSSDWNAIMFWLMEPQLAMVLTGGLTLRQTGINRVPLNQKQLVDV